MPRGRVTKLTAERRDGILKYIESGVFQSVAAACHGVSEPTFWRWMDQGVDKIDPETGVVTPARKLYREFREAVLAARAKAEATVTLHVMQQSRGGDTRASQFFLERSFKQRWGKVEKLEVTDATPKDADRPKFDATKLSTQELLQLEQLLTKGSPEP